MLFSEVAAFIYSMDIFHVAGACHLHIWLFFSSRGSFNSCPRNSLSFWAHIHFLLRCYLWLWNESGAECEAEQFSPCQMVSRSRANSERNSQQWLSPFNLIHAGYCSEIPSWDQTKAFTFICLSVNWDKPRERDWLQRGQADTLSWPSEQYCNRRGPEGTWRLPPVVICSDARGQVDPVTPQVPR